MMGLKRSANGLMAFAVLSLTAAATPASALETHLLAMAACPPWKAIKDDPKTTKLMAESCAKDVATIVPALSKVLKIKNENSTIRLNKDADYAGVTNAIKTLAGKAKSEDRVVIYLNVHGGDVDAEYMGHHIKDEVLALYTEKEPKDFAAATSNGTWMTTKELRDHVDQIQAKEIIIVLEACESTGGLQDFRYDMAKRYKHNWHGREAIIFSSRADQAAAYNEAGTIALFTETFAKHLRSAWSGNIRDIFEKAALQTHRSRRATCMKDDNLDTLYDDRATYLDGCTQMPSVFDPYGLLDDLQIGGKTLASRWDVVEDPAAKKARLAKAKAKKDKDAKSDKVAKASAAKAKATTSKPAENSAKANTTKSDTDPFAWTKDVVGPQTGYNYGYAPTWYGR